MTFPPASTRVRLATPADAAAIAAIYAPYVLETAITFEEVPPTAAVMAGRIEATLKRFPFLVTERDGIVVGYAYASPRGERAAFRWSVDTAIYIAAANVRQGIGAALYATLLRILARQNFAKAYAVIALPNAPSVKLHERVGFRRVATLPAVGFKLGAWHDVGYWEYPLASSLPTEPSEPIAFDDSLMSQ